MRLLYGGIDVYFNQRVLCSAHKVPVIRDFQRLVFAIFFFKLSFMYCKESGMGYGILATYVVDLWCCVYMSSMPHFLRLFIHKLLSRHILMAACLVCDFQWNYFIVSWIICDFTQNLDSLTLLKWEYGLSFWGGDLVYCNAKM